MKRVLGLGILLGLAGCGPMRDEKTEVARPAPRATYARFKAEPNKTAVAKSSVVEPPPVDPEETPPVERPRRSAALEKEVDAYLKEPPIVVTATQLVKAYQNEAAANERFQERKVWITGYVMDTARGVLATPYVKLEPGKTAGGAVVCFFEKGYSEAVENLKENQEVTIEGRVAAKTSNEVRVGECRILTPAEVQSITAAARAQKGNRE